MKEHRFPGVFVKPVILLMVGLVSLSANSLACAGFDEGIAAYRRGDYSKARMEFTKLAEQGHATAQYNLGVMYHKGQGIQQDHVMAVKWLRKAAEQGDADAQFMLGVAYDNGYGVPEDRAEAVKWCRKAAEQGHAEALAALGPVDAQKAQLEAERRLREQEKIRREQAREEQNRRMREHREAVAREFQGEADRRRKAERSRREQEQMRRVQAIVVQQGGDSSRGSLIERELNNSLIEKELGNSLVNKLMDDSLVRGKPTPRQKFVDQNGHEYEMTERGLERIEDVMAERRGSVTYNPRTGNLGVLVGTGLIVDFGTGHIEPY